jgi:hypothetical protein
MARWQAHSERTSVECSTRCPNSCRLGPAGSAKRPTSTAPGRQEPTKLQSREVRRSGGDVRTFELSGESLPRPLRELSVDITDHLPVVAKELGRAMHDVTEKHGSLGPG